MVMTRAASTAAAEPGRAARRRQAYPSYTHKGKLGRASGEGFYRYPVGN